MVTRLIGYNWVDNIIKIIKATTTSKISKENVTVLAVFSFQSITTNLNRVIHNLKNNKSVGASLNIKRKWIHIETSTKCINQCLKQPNLIPSFLKNDALNKSNYNLTTKKHFCPTFSSFWPNLSWHLAVNIWMLMTSIFVVNGRIYHYRFKCNYLKNQIHFCAFYCILLPFLLNLHYIWNILKKNWTSYLTYFWNYWLWKMSLA